MISDVDEKTKQAVDEYKDLANRKLKETIREIKAEVDITVEEEILLTLAENDLSKIEAIKALPAIQIYKNYYRARVQQLNKLYIQIAQLKSIINKEEELKRGR